MCMLLVPNAHKQCCGQQNLASKKVKTFYTLRILKCYEHLSMYSKEVLELYMVYIYNKLDALFSVPIINSWYHIHSNLQMTLFQKPEHFQTIFRYTG